MPQKDELERKLKQLKSKSFTSTPIQNQWLLHGMLQITKASSILEP